MQLPGVQIVIARLQCDTAHDHRIGLRAHRLNQDIGRFVDAEEVEQLGEPQFSSFPPLQFFVELRAFRGDLRFFRLLRGEPFRRLFDVLNLLLLHAESLFGRDELFLREVPMGTA
jgi:hypothetical protein